MSKLCVENSCVVKIYIIRPKRSDRHVKTCKLLQIYYILRGKAPFRPTHRKSGLFQQTRYFIAPGLGRVSQVLNWSNQFLVHWARTNFLPRIRERFASLSASLFASYTRRTFVETYLILVYIENSQTFINYVILFVDYWSKTWRIFSSKMLVMIGNFGGIIHSLVKKGEVWRPK